MSAQMVCAYDLDASDFAAGVLCATYRHIGAMGSAVIILPPRRSEQVLAIVATSQHVI